MIKDLRSPKAKAAAEARARAREQKRVNNQTILEQTSRDYIGQWRPIETCPFTALDETYDIDAAVWVTDGQNIALVQVTRRFGRPVKCVEEPEYALTDDGPMMIGGKYEEFDAPNWWFEWELRDQFKTTIMYGDTVHCEIDFIPTLWMPAKPPLPKTG